MKAININDVVSKLEDDQDVNIIDVREPFELLEGKIPGAINLPLGDLPAKLNELDKAKEYHVVCLSGARSQSAVQFMANQGFNAVNLTGGMMFYQGPIAK
ncbi:rhodanese-related sulfurtransferase [Streptohalobacillus salinus]|uniref:Rhodanese-related sulfurtransferase n=1 Tax=Streptohalobacillus salinus TaxID=621096 RepID=A0A2V3WH34_9BACI|nr:rhodanese-like domain-containing protein [Streptohalobacillus salinus]PXW92714.1 rhodanese-related sulfurtransferase [Streptohalobacillus salinus]